jgi:hypothetical protein
MLGNKNTLKGVLSDLLGVGTFVLHEISVLSPHLQSMRKQTGKLVV